MGGWVEAHHGVRKCSTVVSVVHAIASESGKRYLLAGTMCLAHLMCQQLSHDQ